MDKLTIFYLERFKPWFMNISEYIGILTIYLGIAFILRFLLGWYILPSFVAVFVLGFMIDYWAKKTILEKKIKEIIDEQEENNVKNIVKSNGLIDHPVLDGITSQVKHKLYEDGFYGEKFIGTGELVNEEINNIHKKIKELILQKYRSTKRVK